MNKRFNLWALLTLLLILAMVAGCGSKEYPVYDPPKRVVSNPRDMGYHYLLPTNGGWQEVAESHPGEYRNKNGKLLYTVVNLTPEQDPVVATYEVAIETGNLVVHEMLCWGLPKDNTDQFWSDVLIKEDGTAVNTWPQIQLYEVGKRGVIRSAKECKEE